MFTRRAFSLLLGASLLHWSVATTSAHCEVPATPSSRTAASAHAMPAAHPASHQVDASMPAPSTPDAPQDLPDCCIALGNCAVGTFVVSSDDERAMIAIADRIGDLVTAIPASLQPPPDPPPPRA